jgi:hypothetical protein
MDVLLSATLMTDTHPATTSELNFNLNQVDLGLTWNNYAVALKSDASPFFAMDL